MTKKGKEKASKPKAVNKKSRNWLFLAYPDSAPENWRDIINNTGVKWIESPLHDKDTEPDGEIKKPHWHIIVTFDTARNYTQVQALASSINATLPQVALSVDGSTRYMIHADNPEKYQYDKAKIVTHNGADISKAFAVSASMKADMRYACIREMILFIRENQITEFVDLMEYAMINRYEDWFPHLCDNSAYVIGQVIKSYRHKHDLASNRLVEEARYREILEFVKSSKKGQIIDEKATH